MFTCKLAQRPNFSRLLFSMLSVRLLAHLHIHDNVSNWKWVLYLTWNFFRVYIFTQFLSNSTEHIAINTGSYFSSVAFREWIPVQMKYVLPPSAELDFYKGEHILLLFLTLVKGTFFSSHVDLSFFMLSAFTDFVILMSVDFIHIL